MAPLQSAGKELLRNRTRALAETGRFTSELSSDDWRVQLGTAQALGRRGVTCAPCSQELRALLGSEVAGVRSLASTTLSRAAEETSSLSERTRAMLKSPDWRLRKGAAEAVGRQGPAAAAEHAIDVTVLLSDITPQVRQAAAEALKLMGCAAARAVAAAAFIGNVGTSAKVERDALLLELAKGDGHRAEALACQAQAEALPSDQTAIQSKADVGATAIVERSQVEVVLTDSMLQNSMAPATLEAALASLLKHPDETVRCAVKQVLPRALVDSSVEATSATCQFATIDGSNNDTYSVARDAAPLVPSSPPGPPPSRRPPPSRLRTATTVETVWPVSVTSSTGRMGTTSLPIGRMGTTSSSIGRMGTTSLHIGRMGTTSSSIGRMGTPSDALAMNYSPATLSEMLDAEADHVRLQAVNCFAQVPLEDPLFYADLIVVKLDDGAPRVCVAAAETLGVLGPAVAVHAKAVAAKLDNEQALLRATCARALGRMQAGCFAADLAKLLEDDDPDVQREAGQALGMLGPDAGAPAAQRLRHPDKVVRMAAFKAFVAMRECSKDPNKTALVKALKSHILPVLADEQPEARRIASQLVERLAASRPSSSSAASCFVARLTDLDEEVRIASVRGLAAMPAYAEPHADALAGALADPAEPVRRAAAEAFASLGPKHGAFGVSRTSELLKHALPTVRRAASAAMVSMGPAGKEHAASRQAALLADAVPAVRTNAVDGLAALSREEVVDPSLVAQVALLHVDRHWSVRLAVAQALLRFGGAAVLEHKVALEVLCADEDWRVRRAADAANRAMPTSAPLQTPAFDASEHEWTTAVAAPGGGEEERGSLATGKQVVEEFMDSQSCAHPDVMHDAQTEAAALRIQCAQRRRLADKLVAVQRAEARRSKARSELAEAGLLEEMDASAAKIQRIHRQSSSARKSHKSHKDDHAHGHAHKSHSHSSHSQGSHGHGSHRRTTNSHKEGRSTRSFEEPTEEEIAVIRIQRTQRERLARQESKHRHSHHHGHGHSPDSRRSTKHKKHNDEDEEVHSG